MTEEFEVDGGRASYTDPAPPREASLGIRPWCRQGPLDSTSISWSATWSAKPVDTRAGQPPSSDALEVFLQPFKSVIQIPPIWSYWVAPQKMGLKLVFSSPTFSTTLVSVGSNKEMQNVLWLGWIFGIIIGLVFEKSRADEDGCRDMNNPERLRAQHLYLISYQLLYS